MACSGEVGEVEHEASRPARGRGLVARRFWTGRFCDNRLRRPSVLMVRKSSRSQPTRFSAPTGSSCASGNTP
ncbi:hypothetical protein P8C59_001582 [Phyllachora maydis]|uniref:Uncharacterized protein n=1 Tax=Phyllachora maydis TaxID=1825666 RepID=A0AAD9MBJ7_9PEZI|nr:hypothetical protein P8C59_001582 [Phyllachora maydis]